MGVMKKNRKLIRIFFNIVGTAAIALTASGAIPALAYDGALQGQVDVKQNDLLLPSDRTLSCQLGFPVYSWRPQEVSEAKAIVVALHGATLHGRSFETLGKVLAERNYLVFAGDMRGFGAWNDELEAPNVPNPKHIIYKQSQADVLNLLEKLRGIYPDKPIYLMGESVGANMALSLLAIEPFCADGAILSSPAIKQRYFFGPTIIKQFLTVMFKPSAQLSVEPYIKSRISHNGAITQERLSDPLSRNFMNVGELFKTRWFNKSAFKLLCCVPEHIGILILEGRKDQLFDSDDVENLMAQLKTRQKELQYLPDKGHINLETRYLDTAVISKVSSWLDTASRAQSKVTTAKVEADSADSTSVR